jgi:5-(carboxyamino)imidazole ribonucleotide synthase
VPNPTPDRKPDSNGPLVAILGGGQLGWMLGLAGIPLGLRFRFLDPTAEASARRVGDLVVGALDDLDAVAAATADAVVCSYEWEGVPSASARFVEERGVTVRPAPNALDVAQDRLAEKGRFRALGIPTPEFRAVDDEEGLRAAIESVGVPAILKTRRGGYDGKGQVVIQDPSAVADAWSTIGGVPAILEARVAFVREVSVLAVRGVDGDTRFWPIGENLHRDGILRRTRAPAPELTDELQRSAESIAARLLDDLGYVGVLAVELFEAQDGTLLANEIAPRVHNSGHWTIEGAATSQFENHLRAVLGMPLGSTAVTGESVMLNCIGSLPGRDAVRAVTGAHLHDYGKAPRPGRKVGHITITAPTTAELDDRLRRLEGSLE